MDDISRLQEWVASDQPELITLWDQIDRERAEKLELRHKV